MIVKPVQLLDRQSEWSSLVRFIDRKQQFAVVYGPRRVGKSFLLDALCEAAGGYRHQAVTGISSAQLDDLGRDLGQWLGVGRLHLDGWADAFERFVHLDTPVVVIDELPYLLESSPELVGMLQRHVDRAAGPSLIVAGSSMSTMADLIAPRAPLFGRAAAVVVPTPFEGPDLANLWGLTDPISVLWVDAALGGLAGYRPLLVPPHDDLDQWMVDEVLAPSSPLLDAAELSLLDQPDIGPRALLRTILNTIASGERRFAGIARMAGQPSSALTRPLAALERAGLVDRIPDPLRTRRDSYQLGDPHLQFWLSVIAPARSQLLAGRASQIWPRIAESTWQAQILGPRWEAIVRSHVARVGIDGTQTADLVGSTVVSNRKDRTSHEVDVVAMAGRTIIAIGEAKLGALGQADLDRLRRIRELLDAPNARLLLASATAVTVEDSDLLTIVPGDVYGST